MQRWEYCILMALETAGQSKFTIAYANRIETPPENGRLSILTEMGRIGWEMVAVQPLAQGLNEFYFKRPAHN